jgi:uncharacterized membrane protein YkoI
MRATLLIFALWATLAIPAAFADDGNEGYGDNHEKLDDARKHGKILPIEQLLKLIKERLKGEIVEIELDDNAGSLYYEVYYLDSGGRRNTVYVDAATGAILKNKLED